MGEKEEGRKGIHATIYKLNNPDGTKNQSSRSALVL